MSEADRHTLQRFVAGLDVEADALAAAITGQAIEETIVDEALLRQLASDEAVVRRRAARRIAAMPLLAPAVAARLRVLAETDEDERTRAAALTALEAHAPSPPPAPGRRRLTLLRLAPVLVRGGAFAFRAAVHEDAPYLGGRLSQRGGVVELALAGLPDAFAGRRPSVVVGDAELARAAEPVSAAGAVTIAFPAELGTAAELAARLAACELVVFAD